MKPLVLVVAGGQSLPLPAAYRTVNAANADEAIKAMRSETPAAIVVASSPDLVPIVVSRLKSQTGQPIVAVTPNDPRESIKAVNAGAWDAAVLGTLPQSLQAAVEDGARIQQGRPERLGPYELVATIGRGSMATVWQATEGGRDVALKVLFPELSMDREFVERFEREARSAATLTHPNLTAVYGHGRSRWRLWIAMELLRGRSLQEILRVTVKLDPWRAVAIAKQIALGLGYAHSRGFIHRDIKPANIVVDDSGAVKIMDFGLIKSTRGDEPAITAQDEFVGTAAYAAPEQVRSRPVDGRSDLYALGVVLFEMVCGRRPFAGGDMLMVLRAKESGQPTFTVSELNPACPPAVVAIIEKLMMAKPEDRFQDAAAVVKAFDAVNR